jgi:hypothetical protein
MVMNLFNKIFGKKKQYNFEPLEAVVREWAKK